MKDAMPVLAKNFVSNLYNADTPNWLAYHNLTHTEGVVAHCRTMADHYQLDEPEKTNLLIAAWFHDVGQLYTTPEKHEEKSVEIMRSFAENNSPIEDLSSIEQIILATKVSVKPNSLLEEIIRDADTYHFGTKQFFVTDALVKKEMELRCGVRFGNWQQQSLRLLKEHFFYTAYCKELLTLGKQENISTLETEL